MDDSRTTINATEAAEILGEDCLAAMIEHGVLTPTSNSSTKKRFDPNDIELLSSVLNKELTLPMAVGLARLSEFRARRAERLVTQLMGVLGINLPSLSIEPEELNPLYLRAVDDLSEDRYFSTDELADWAKAFFALGEEHLEALAAYLQKETYQTFLDLNTKLKQVAKKSNDPADQLLSKYLEQAGRALRNTVFFFVQKKYGVRASRKASGRTGAKDLNINEELIALLFTEVTTQK